MIGQTLDGKYQIKTLLGSGAMGSVYEAEHASTGRRVALKVITAPDIGRDSTTVARFQREARAAGAIDTQHITQILDAGFDQETNRSYLVMEYLTGEDLQQTLKRVGPLAPDLALRVIAQACLGLHKAHKASVVHRDIKPANLFLAHRDAGEVIVKLLDFGIAKVKMDQAQSADDAALTKTGSMIEITPLYMSPEQARGDVKNIDHRTDIWSMGIVFYQALCGSTPYQHATALGELIIAICGEFPRNIQEVAPWVPAPVAAIVHQCLRHSKDERYASAEELFLACKALLPNGWNISEEMIVSLEDTARKEVAQKFALTNVHAGAQTAVVPLSAGAGTVGAVTQSVSSSQPATIVAAPRSNGTALALGAAAVVALGGIGAYALTRPPPAPAIVAAPSAPPPVHTPPTSASPPEPKVAPSAPTPEVAPAGDSAMRRVKVVVAPLDASIDVDGTKATLNKQGLLEITGKLGSNHRVTLTKGKSETTVDVAITEDGPSVPKIEIAPPGAKPTAATTASVAAPPTPQPKPGIMNQFE